MVVQSEVRRRTYGQYFTPETICALACAAAIEPGTQSVLDPTCGTGTMLVAAASRLSLLCSEGVSVTGIEIDPTIEVSNGGSNETTVLFGDLFDYVGQRETVRLQPHSFDAVVGNPPYVRFETLGPLYALSNPALINRMHSRFPRRGRGELAALGIKTLLLASCLDDSLNEADRLLAAESCLLAGSPPPGLAGADQLWADAVIAYPVRADLSIPVWLAAWRLLRAGGRVAFVTTDSWQSRAYGAPLREFMEAALRPAFIVQQRGTWFRDAQIRASLVVLEARGALQADDCLVVDVSRDANLADAEEFMRIAGQASGLPPSFDAVAVAAESIVVRMKAGDQPSVWTTERVSPQHVLRPRRVSSTGSGPARLVPEQLREAVGIPVSARLVSLAEIGAAVHQGLRTGCNPFFYVTEIGRDGHRAQVRLSDEIGGSTLEIDPRYLNPVVRYQRDVKGWSTIPSEHGDRVLVLSNALSSADFQRALDRYPREWIDTWITTAGLHPLDGDLDAHVITAANWSLFRNGRHRRVAELSAVRPNTRWPSLAANQVQAPPRGWYSIALAPRHVPDILVPRVVDRAPRFCLNEAQMVVDANFSGVLAERDEYPPFALLALLNSSWIHAWLEATCTPMGGGALKVEALQLSEMVVPRPSSQDVDELVRLGRDLVRGNAMDPRWLQRVDAIVLAADGSSLGAMRAKLKEFANRMRTRRSPRSAEPDELAFAI